MKLTSRIGIVAGVLAATCLLAVFFVEPVPGFALRLFGGAGGGVERYGGLRIQWHPPAGADLDAIAAKLAKHRAHVRVEHGALVIEVPGVSVEEAADVAAMTGVNGGLEFREVIESEAAAVLVDLGLAFDDHGGKVATDEPTVEIDQWMPEEGGGRHQDFYLTAHSETAIAQAFRAAEQRGWQRPANTVIAYERIDPPPDAKDQRPYYRSYFVRDRVELDGDSVANAEGNYDPNTNRPIVILEFDRAGADRFAELTGRIVGHKLATLLGGRVKSAPIINSPIRGGRAQITMGGSDPYHQERERDALVKTLRAGTLPPGGELLSQQYVEPETHPIATLLARLAIGLVGGLLCGVLAAAFVRLARSEARPVVALGGAAPIWRRVVWTLGAIAIYLLGAQITLPGINDVELGHVLARGGGSHVDLGSVSVFALGIMPLVFAFVVVEIIAAIVPPLRPLRDRPEGRRKLAYFVAGLAIVWALVQGYFIARWLEALSFSGAEVVVDPGLRMRGITMVTLAGGTMLLAWLASLIGQRGIGNGYALLLVASWLYGIHWDNFLLAPADLLVGMVAVVVIVVLVMAMLRLRVGGKGQVSLPLPVSGAVPLAEAGGLWIVILQLSTLGVIDPYHPLVRWLEPLSHQRIATFIGLVISAGVWSFVFARPGRRRAELARAGLQPATTATWLRALVLGTVILAAVIGVAIVGKTLAPFSAPLLETSMLVFAIATIADVAGELRDRKRGLVPVWPLHDPLLVDVVRARLAAESIPHHMQAANARALLWLFGPHIPVMVLVPEEHAAAAEKSLRELFG